MKDHENAELRHKIEEQQKAAGDEIIQLKESMQSQADSHDNEISSLKKAYEDLSKQDVPQETAQVLIQKYLFLYLAYFAFIGILKLNEQIIIFVSFSFLFLFFPFLFFSFSLILNEQKIPLF